MKRLGHALASWVLLFPTCLAIVVQQGTPADDVVAGPGVTVADSDFAGSPNSIRSFTEGPFGIGSGVLISSGASQDAAPGGFANSDQGAPGNGLCNSPSSFDAAVFTLDLFVDSGFNGILV